MAVELRMRDDVDVTRIIDALLESAATIAINAADGLPGEPARAEARARTILANRLGDAHDEHSRRDAAQRAARGLPPRPDTT